MRCGRSVERDGIRRGVVAIFAAICLIVIVGVVALVVDSGIIRDRRQHLQGSADAAALAAAIELFHSYQSVGSGTPDPGGRAAASASAILQDNGYSVANANVTLNIPPQNSQSGFNGLAGYVEVIVTFTQPRHFSTVFGGGDIPVRARAIARGGYQPLMDRIIILDPSAPAAFSAGGDAYVMVHGGNVLVNSSDSQAAQSTGRGVDIQDPDLGDSLDFKVRVHGGFGGVGGFLPAPQTGVAPVPDPLRTLPPPDRASLPAGSISQTGLNVTMTPGVYAARVSFTGAENITMQPGIYYFDQGFNVQTPGAASGSLTGNQVMIYNASTNPSDTIEIVGKTSVTLSPPTSGIYEGISIYQNRASTAVVTIANNTLYDFAGAIYAANALVLVEVQGTMNLKSHLISRKLAIVGQGDMNFLDPPFTPRFRKLELVE